MHVQFSVHISLDYYKAGSHLDIDGRHSSYRGILPSSSNLYYHNSCCYSFYSTHLLLLHYHPVSNSSLTEKHWECSFVYLHMDCWKEEVRFLDKLVHLEHWLVGQSCLYGLEHSFNCSAIQQPLNPLPNIIWRRLATREGNVLILHTKSDSIPQSHYC